MANNKKKLSEALLDTIGSPKKLTKKPQKNDIDVIPVREIPKIQDPVIINKPQPPKYTKKKYTKDEINKKLENYMQVSSKDFGKIDLGEFIRFFKNEDFYAGGQIIYLGFNKEKNSAFWIYTTSLIPVDGKFASRYTVFWKDITRLYKRFGRPLEIEILNKKITDLQASFNTLVKLLKSKYGVDF